MKRKTAKIALFLMMVIILFLLIGCKDFWHPEPDTSNSPNNAQGGSDEPPPPPGPGPGPSPPPGGSGGGGGGNVPPTSGGGGGGGASSGGGGGGGDGPSSHPGSSGGGGGGGGVSIPGLHFNLINGGTAYAVNIETTASSAVVIPATYNGLPVTEIGSRVDSSTRGGPSSINIPASVTSIGTYAFEDFTNLTSVTFVSSSMLKTIDYAAFSRCTSLSSISIPNSVTFIGDMAFRECLSLSYIAIPASVISISDGAFRECTSLTSVSFQGTSIVAISSSSFDGDLLDKYHAASGGPGTYTRPSGGSTWTKM